MEGRGNDNTGWRTTLAAGLQGKGAHVSPARAVAGLTAIEAAQTPPGAVHSAHRMLRHIVLWQDLMLTVMEGHAVTWPSEADDWSGELPEWDVLRGLLADGLERARYLAASADLDAALSECWPGVSVGGALTVLITHNSYHLGQLVDARRATGHWPPPA